MQLEELTQVKRLLGELFRVGVIGKQLGELVAKHGQAARLDADHRDAGLNLRSDLVDDALEESPRQIQEAEVIQRSSTAQPAIRNHDLEAGGLQDLGAGDGCFRLGIGR